MYNEELGAQWSEARTYMPCLDHMNIDDFHGFPNKSFTSKDARLAVGR